MARPGKTLGRDWPINYRRQLPGAAAGSAADAAALAVLFEVPQARFKQLPGQLGKGLDGTLKSTALFPRVVEFINEAAADTVATGATNFCTMLLNVYRNAVLQGCLAYYPLNVSTTLGTAVNVPPALAQVSPASMAGLLEGLALICDTAASEELIYAFNVNSPTANAINAYFTKSHLSSATIKSGLRSLQATAFLMAMAVNTTSGASTVGAPGAATITPGNVLGIHVGDTLLCDTGGSQETVTVTAVTNSTFTATFANAHSAGFAIKTASLKNGNPFILQPGDVVTYERLSNNVTGLATPAGVLQVDLDIAGELFGSQG